MIWLPHIKTVMGIASYRTSSMPALSLGCRDRCQGYCPLFFDGRFAPTGAGADNAPAWVWWAAQGDLPDQPPGRSWQSGRFLLVSLRTNARVIPRARLDTRDRDCARQPWHARRFVWR